MTANKPTLYTILSPALLNLYDTHHSVVVIIDVLRATSTIATALYNGAETVMPVDSLEKCIALGKSTGGITAGEREGRVIEGLQHGNSPLEYHREFIKNKTLVLTTTNGTKLLHMALESGAENIVTGAFSNLSAVVGHLISRQQNVILACGAWKDRINIEDTLFAGAVVDRVKGHFQIDCDASSIAHSVYTEAGPDLFSYVKTKHASHYIRLSSYGLEEDIRYCLTPDTANVLPVYSNGKLSVG
ncbi:MAG: 2-phosphosulfolactate phosphatase [Chitinophagaceae bacterium]|nr:2-phosphosulfolactate phosphatase [Chitinophagaceae bacterium]MCW5929335.1 2-phosphosulfolactate phosphatase [Chitinophagaceae bacterium]